MPDSQPNSPTQPTTKQPAGYPKFHFQSPGTYLPAVRQLSMGDEDFHMEASAPAWVHGSAGTAHGHSGFASYPPAPRMWVAPLTPVNSPGLVAHGRPQLAPMDIGLAMGSSNGYIVAEFETLLLPDSHSHYEQPSQDFTPQQNLEPLYAQQALEAALTGCSLDENSEPSAAMSD